MTEVRSSTHHHLNQSLRSRVPLLRLCIFFALVLIAAIYLESTKQEPQSSASKTTTSTAGTKFQANSEQLKVTQQAETPVEHSSDDRGDANTQKQGNYLTNDGGDEAYRYDEKDERDQSRLGISKDRQDNNEESDANNPAPIVLGTRAETRIGLQKSVDLSRTVGGSSHGLTLGPLPRDVQPGVKRWNYVALDTCLSQGEPDRPENSWEMRAPHFIVLGHHKSGTQALTQYLWQHPQIAPNALEMHFFGSKSTARFTSDQGVSRRDGRKIYQTALMKKVPQDLFPPFTSEKSKMVTFDTTPRYFLDADRNPSMIICLVPWAKLIVLFRDPVERVLSHYNYLNQARQRNNRQMVDWRDWINDDLKSLRTAGVIDDDRSLQKRAAFAGSEEEAQAWAAYTRSSNSQFLLGRGLYAIQLRLWFAAMDKVGKEYGDLHVVRSENLKTDTQGEYSKLLEFLGLKDHLLTYSGSYHETKDENYKPVSMPDDIRSELQDFFAPYNKQVYEILGEQWDGVWDPK